MPYETAQAFRVAIESSDFLVMELSIPYFDKSKKLKHPLVTTA